ncbi:hypothetical protein CRM22_008357 [Opisthorchis felineus]|uniref:Uncharacterized protein n=1 Tax=Opisthorchis felineus TaxID=147828 RepID=A0A4S2LBI8_OPIFE|nr:hypothetical protein CRM22_008357 [Opisthorchis felineus]
MTTVDLETADSGDSQAEESPVEETEKSVGRLREEALQRKDRLLQLRKRKFKKLGDIGDEDAESDLPKPVFRNYKPQSGDLKSGELPAAPPVDLTPYVTSQLEAANAPVIMEEVTSCWWSSAQNLNCTAQLFLPDKEPVNPDFSNECRIPYLTTYANCLGF